MIFYSVVCAVMTTKELEAGFGCDEEIIVKAGQSHSIPIQLDEPGLILCWEFASAPKVSTPPGRDDNAPFTHPIRDL